MHQHKCTLELSFPDNKTAKNAYSSLSCEEENKNRSSLSMSLSGKTLIITISSKDLVALRAHLNSILRLAQVIKDVDEIDETKVRE
ncbi:MAG: KEOPS complex subunit Pcc1 [Candidatus Anstonellales archaeon]